MGDQSASEVAELKRKLGNAVRKGKAIEAQYKEAKARLEGADAIASRVAELEAALEQKDVAEERQLAEAEAAHADTLEKLQDITARHLEALERAGRLEKELEEGRAAWQAKPAASTPHGAESPHANGTTAVAHQLQQLNEGLRKQLEDAQSHLSVAEHQLAERSDSTSSVSGVDAQALAELTDEVEVLKEALDVAADKIRDLQTSEQEAVARSNTLAKECAELRKTASAATARVEEAVATEQAATQAAEQAARLEKVARDRVLALEVELAAAQESAAQAQQVAEQVADLEAQVAHAEERAAAAETAAAEAVADATARTENAAAREAAADERLQQAEAEVAKAQAEAARLAEENESRRQKFSVLHVTFAKKEAEFKEALEVAEAEVASSRAAAADAEEAELAARKAKIEAER